MATEYFKIPLTNVPQRFDIELVGRSLTMMTKWNGETPAWELNIIDSITGKPLIVSLPLASGVDLLAQYRHLGLPGSLIVSTDGDQDATPTLQSLGAESNLYYVLER